MNSYFRLKVDASEIAAKISQTKEVVETKLKPAIENLSIATHAFIVNKANETFKDSKFKREYYLGLNLPRNEAQKESTHDERIDNTAKHVRWIKLSNNIWMVELDEKATWLEEGREPTFMGEWLLKPGSSGVKTAKDGSSYRVIPFKQTQGNKQAEGAKPLFAELVKKQAKRQGISLRNIERDESGAPKLGTLHKLRMIPTSTQEKAPSLFSRPRTEEQAAETGLKPHGGIYKLEGAVVVQRKNKKGKVKRETVVFRVISSKHKAENRWMYPKVTAANIFPQAYDWALKELEKIVKSIEEEVSR
jgi:hypothetical protein